MAAGISYPSVSTVVPKINLNDSDDHPIALINKKRLGVCSDEERSDSSSSEQDVNHLKASSKQNRNVSNFSYHSSSSSLIYNTPSVFSKDKVTRQFITIKNKFYLFMYFNIYQKLLAFITIIIIVTISHIKQLVVEICY